MRPRYPIYIPSKGRADQQLTSRALDRIGVPHYVIVEEQERELYEANRSPTATLLTLDPSYRDRYVTLDDLGDSRSYGAGPARNMAWDHALASGAERHWNIDDNIRCWFRYNRNLQIPCADGTPLRVIEDFVDRYDTVALAGPQYFMFVARKYHRYPPFALNTRIYSCTLIRNDLPFRWRLRMNEDTDLSLQVLKAGWATVLVYAFTQFKQPTQTMKGGYNAEGLYATHGTKWKSQMLADAHPDVARVVWKYGRWHHHVDYSPFRQNVLRLRPGVTVPSGTDEYGLVMERRDEYGNWVPDRSRRWDIEMPLGDLQIGMGM